MQVTTLRYSKADFATYIKLEFIESLSDAERNSKSRRVCAIIEKLLPCQFIQVYEYDIWKTEVWVGEMLEDAREKLMEHFIGLERIPLEMVFNSRPNYDLIPHISRCFNQIDRPVYKNREKKFIVDEILSYQREANEIFTEKEFMERGKFLSTIGDSELCYIWYSSAGEYILKQQENILELDEEISLLQNQHANTISGTLSNWKRIIEYPLDLLDRLLCEKGEMIEAIMGYVKDFPPLLKAIVEEISSHMDTVTACIILESMNRDGVWKREISDLIQYRNKREYDYSVRRKVSEVLQSISDIEFSLGNMSYDSVDVSLTAVANRWGRGDGTIDFSVR